MGPLVLLRRRLRRFARAQEGVAAVEFVLILPFLLILFLGSIEASSLITVDRRINVISGTVGDLIARWDSKGATVPVPTATLSDYFKAAAGIIFPYSDGDLKQVISVVEINTATGVTKVKASCGWNGGAARAIDSAYALPANLKSIAQAGGWVIASEASYLYTPVLGMELAGEFDLRSESFYLPRYERQITFQACPTS